MPLRALALLLAFALAAGLWTGAPVMRASAAQASPGRASCCCGTGVCKMTYCHTQAGANCSMSACQPASQPRALGNELPPCHAALVASQLAASAQPVRHSHSSATTTKAGLDDIYQPPRSV